MRLADADWRRRAQEHRAIVDRFSRLTLEIARDARQLGVPEYVPSDDCSPVRLPMETPTAHASPVFTNALTRYDGEEGG